MNEKKVPVIEESVPKGCKGIIGVVTDTGGFFYAISSADVKRWTTSEDKQKRIGLLDGTYTISVPFGYAVNIFPNAEMRTFGNQVILSSDGCQSVRIPFVQKIDSTEPTFLLLECHQVDVETHKTRLS